MSPSEGRNPEHRSNNALLCFCIGAGLCILAWFAGVGAVMAAAFTGGDPTVVVGGMLATIGLVLLGMSGFVLMLIGGVWMFLRVVADQTGENRYRDVER